MSQRQGWVRTAWDGHQAPASNLSVWSAFSLLSLISLASVGSVLSVLSAGSFLSVWSVGSILSINSVNSVLTIGCKHGVLQVCNTDTEVKNFKFGSVDAFPRSPRPELPLIVHDNTKCSFGKCDKKACQVTDTEIILDNKFKYKLEKENVSKVIASMFMEKYDVPFPWAQLVKIKSAAGAFETRTLTEVPNLEHVTQSSFKNVLEAYSDEEGVVFDFFYVFSVYLAELLSGTTNGWCRGGNQNNVAAYKHENGYLVVPDESITTGENKCNTFAALKPDTMPDCKPMQLCLSNSACKKQWETFSSDSTYKCAYTNNEFYALFGIPLAAISAGIFVVSINIFRYR